MACKVARQVTTTDTDAVCSKRQEKQIETHRRLSARPIGLVLLRPVSRALYVCLFRARVVDDLIGVRRKIHSCRGISKDFINKQSKQNCCQI